MYYITIISKNENTIKNIYKIFQKLDNNKNLNLNIVKKYLQNKNKKHILSILKSPHVNKIAQEQFELGFIYRKILIKPTTKNLKFLILLKKMGLNLFHDAKIIANLVSKKKFKNHNYELFNLNNFKLKKKSKYKKNINHFRYLW